MKAGAAFFLQQNTLKAAFLIRKKKNLKKSGNCVLSKCSGVFFRERANCERLEGGPRRGDDAGKPPSFPDLFASPSTS